MLNIRNLRYLTNSEGERIGVVLPIKEYERLIKPFEDIKKLKEK
jgi:hypothetical protein